MGEKKALESNSYANKILFASVNGYSGHLVFLLFLSTFLLQSMVYEERNVRNLFAHIITILVKKNLTININTKKII